MKLNVIVEKAVNTVNDPNTNLKILLELNSFLGWLGQFNSIDSARPCKLYMKYFIYGFGGNHIWLAQIGDEGNRVLIATEK